MTGFCKHNAAFKSALVLWLILGALLSTLTCAYAQEDQLIDASDLKAIQASKAAPEKPTDWFGWALVAISFGGMFLVSSVHWLHSHRSKLESEISTLSNFITQTNSIEFSINMSDDAEPMMNGIDQIHDERAIELNALKGDSDLKLRVLTDVESKLLRRLG